VKVHFTRAKGKRQLQGEYDDNWCRIKEHEKEIQIRIVEWKNETKQEHNTKGGMTNEGEWKKETYGKWSGVHAT